MDWAEKVRYIEKELGYENDRGFLAKILGVRPGLISDIKSGKSKNPGADITLLFINKLGVNPDWLDNETMPVFINPVKLKKQPNNINHYTDKLKKQPIVNILNFIELISSVKERLPVANNAELERYLELSNGYLSKFENGTIKNPNSLLKALSRKGFKFKCDIREGSPIFILIPPDNLKRKQKKDTLQNITSEPSVEYQPGIPLVYEGNEDGIVIPLLGNAASAGYGNELDDDDTPVRYVQVPRHLSKFPHLASLPIKGDSMEPTLHDGDLVVCDGGDWDGDGIYVLKTHDTFYVKRVQVTSQGYEVISDNKMYKSITESAESLSIVGKVRAILVIVPGRRGGV